MLLVWGWRSRLKTLSEGDFHCPHCGVDRGYRHREARRWFTLFWIPMIPLKVLGTFIECATCGSGYDERVLTLPTNTTIADNLSIAVRGLVTSVIAADGSIDVEERALAIDVVGRFAEHAYGPDDLDRDLAQYAGRDVDGILGELAGTLNEHGKEQILRACIELAHADGSIDDAELEVVQRAGAALLMTPAHVRGVIGDAVERLA